MVGNALFANWALMIALAFLVLGFYVLVVAFSVWKERGMEAARWIVVSDVMAFAVSILFWLFWFFC